MAHPTPAEAAAAPARSARSFRPDIDGLRAVAILLVVAYHVGFGAVRGGFVGVYFFFVISGFLITGKLLAEVQTSSGVRLRSFWAGRVRRLVPALAAMVAVVLVLALVALSPIEWNRAATEGAASLAYVSNLLFARQATDYFAADPNASLFLHTWSLGVEEQFYLLWPLLVVGIAWCFRRRVAHRRGAFVVALSAVGVVSFGLATILTARGSPWSFFSLPTRAWEFAVGGLLASFLLPRTGSTADAAGGQDRDLAVALESGPSAGAASAGARPHALGASVGAALGVGLVIVAAVTFSDATPYPGVATVVPVLGTAMIILAGHYATRSPVIRALGVRPAQRLGRVSYSWYLWHWPFILLAVAVLGHDTTTTRLAGALVGLAIAAVALFLVENPIRFDARLVARPARTFAVGAGVTLIGLALTFGVHRAAQRRLDEPFYRRIEVAQAGAAAGGDAVCRSTRSPDGIEYCEYGDPTATKTVLLTGDSHAAQWVPAFAAAAHDEQIRLLVHTRGGCPSVDVPIARSTTRLVPSENCLQFRRDTERLIDTFHPNAVVLANADYEGRILDDHNTLPDAAGQLDIWQQGLRSTIASLQRTDRRVGVVLENPGLAADPNICLARTQSIDGCTPTRSEALTGSEQFNSRQRAVTDAAGPIPTFDIAPTLCGPTTCVLEHDGELVYQDAGHLTPGFTASQAPAIAGFLRSVLGG